MGLKRGTSKLTQEQTEEVILMKIKGLYNNQIAKHFNVPHWIIGYILRENNLKSFHTLSEKEVANVIQLNVDGYSNSEIARVVGVTDVAVGRLLKRNNLSTNLRRIESVGERIIEMHHQGLSSLKISEQIGFSDSNIGLFLKRNGLFPKKFRSIEMVDDCHAKCSRCHEVKEILNWPMNGRAYCSYCLVCLQKRVRRNSETNRNPFRLKCHHIKKRCRESGIVYNLSEACLETLWNKQNGLCFYTDQPMVLDTKSFREPTAMSVDKIIPGEGYVIGNVVLCQTRINTMKSNATLEEMRIWMPSWFEKIKKFRSSI